MPVPVSVKLAQDRAKREAQAGLGDSPQVEVQLPAAEHNGEPQTTLMIHHLPIRATIFQLFDHLDALGFKGCYDYVHFPVDIRTRMHRGYAFVNFLDPAHAALCVSRIEGTQLAATASEKRLTAGPATHQGVKANLQQMVQTGPKKNRRKAAELPWLLDGGEMKPMLEAPLLH